MISRLGSAAMPVTGRAWITNERRRTDRLTFLLRRPKPPKLRPKIMPAMDNGSGQACPNEIRAAREGQHKSEGRNPKSRKKPEARNPKYNLAQGRSAFRASDFVPPCGISGFGLCPRMRGMLANPWQSPARAF